MMKKRSLITFLLAMTLLCSCEQEEVTELVSENSVVSDTEKTLIAKTETTEEITESVLEKSEDYELNVDLYENLNNELEYINDVTVIRDKIFISGKKIICNNKLTVDGEIIQADLPDNPKRYSFIEDKFYITYHIENFDDDKRFLKIIDIKNNEETTYEIPSDVLYFFKGNKDNILYYSTQKLCICSYNLLTSEIKTVENSDVYEDDGKLVPIKGHIVIKEDSEGNIYAFYKNKNNTMTLQKYDSALNLVYQYVFEDIKMTDGFDMTVDENISLSVDTEDITLNMTADCLTGEVIEQKEIEKTKSAYNTWTTSDGREVHFEVENSEEFQYVTIVKDLNGNIIKEIPLTEKTDQMNHILVGKVYVTEQENIFFEELYTETINRIDANGEQSSFTVPFGLSSVGVLAVDSKNNIFTSNGGSVYIYDEKGNQKSVVDVCDSVIYTMCCDDLYIYDRNNELVVKMNAESEETEEICKDIYIKDIFENKSDNSLYCVDNSGIVVYDFETMQKEEILHFQKNGLNDFGKVSHFKDDVFIWNSYSECGFIQNKNEVFENEITVGFFCDLNVDYDYLLRGNIDIFNFKNPDTHVVYKRYSDNTIESDIINGNIDVVVNSKEEYDKALFADIYSFLENDDQIKKDDFFENILDLYTYEDKLYMITPFFWVSSDLYKNEITDKICEVEGDVLLGGPEIGFSILESSEEKELAWDFVKYHLTDNFMTARRYEAEYYQGIPLRRSALDKMWKMSDAITEEEYKANLAIIEGISAKEEE